MPSVMMTQQADAEKTDDRVRVGPVASPRTPVPARRELPQRRSLTPMVPATASYADSGPGQRLPAELRSELEVAFAFDFSHVRVHTDREAGLSADAIGARAYTVGNHVLFGPGAFAPETADGKRLIAHELAHVVQQSGTRAPAGTVSLPIDSTGELGAEQAADAMVRHPPHIRSRLGGSHLAVRPTRRASHTPVIQRQAASATTIPMKVVPHGASEAAVKAAEAQMREVLATLKAANLAQLRGETIELHIIPANRKLTDLPEYATLKGVPTWDRRRAYDDIRGAGAQKVGSVIRYAIAEEQLVKVRGHPMGYAPGFVGTHESGHVVQQFALTKRQSDDLTAAYNARVKARGPWLAPAWYTSGSVGEYFAQGTAAYFGHPYSTSHDDKKTYTKDWLRKNDPALFKLLDEIYGATPAAHLPPSFRPRTDFTDKMLKDVENL